MTAFSFGSPASAEADVLSFLGAAIDGRELDLLKTEGGFNPPNAFDVKRVIEPLELRRFPLSDWYEYEWAIYECEWDRLRRYSPAMKAYLGALYAYCNKRRQWSIVIDSDYYLLGIEAALEFRDPALAQHFSRFIEWLQDWVGPDEGYEDYYALLSWLLLQRLAPTADEPTKSAVLAALAAKGYSSQRLSELTVSERGVDAWLALHRRLPPTDSAQNAAIEAVITGRP